MDLTQIKNEEQLIALVKVRYGLPYETARADIQGWMTGKQFNPLVDVDRTAAAPNPEAQSAEIS